VWSEVAKKKQEEKVDIDFSELASLDDFFKDTGSQNGNTKSLNSQTKPKKQRSKKRYEPARNQDGYDNAFAGQVNQKSVTQINYDELPSLSGVVNYDSMSKDESSYDLNEDAKKLFSHDHVPVSKAQPKAHPINISFDRESIVKAFVMSEVLQRYDLNRIYSRIPDFNQPED